MDLSLASLVRASSGALLAAFGLYLLTVRPATLRSRALGVYHLTLGPVFIGTNLLRPDIPALALAFQVSGPLWLLSAAALVGLAWGETRGDRLAQGTFAAGFVVVLAATIAAAFLVPADLAGAFIALGSSAEEGAMLNEVYDRGRLWYAALHAAGPVTALALAVRFRSVPDALARRHLALLAAGIAVYPLYDKAAYLLSEPSARVEGWIAMPVFALAAIAWAIAARGRASSAARNTALVLAITGIAGIAAALAGDDYGLIGVSRLVGLAILAYGVFRVDLLGTDFTSRTVRRGSVATGGLATLFIVAQVAQEFFAAEYGLLMGGIVAGALLFTARPIERATERLARGSSVVDAGGSNGNEESYRRALRLALRGGPFSPEDDVHLAELGERLRIPAGRARAIYHEVERELGGEAP